MGAKWRAVTGVDSADRPAPAPDAQPVTITPSAIVVKILMDAVRHQRLAGCQRWAPFFGAARHGRRVSWCSNSIHGERPAPLQAFVFVMSFDNVAGCDMYHIMSY